MRYVMFYKPAGCVTARRDDRYPTVLDYFEEETGDQIPDARSHNLFPEDSDIVSGEPSEKLSGNQNQSQSKQESPIFTHVGRLDRETEGLLLLTDDGRWCQKILHPSGRKEKEYEFWVLGDLTEEGKALLEAGVFLGQETNPTAPAKITIDMRCRFYEIQDQLFGEVAEKLSRNKPDTPVTGGRIIITEGKKNQIRRMMKHAGCFCIFLRRVRIGRLWLDPTLRPGQYRELTPEETILCIM